MWIKLVAPIMLSAVSNAEFPKSSNEINKCYWIEVFTEKTSPLPNTIGHLTSSYNQYCLPLIIIRVCWNIQVTLKNWKKKCMLRSYHCAVLGVSWIPLIDPFQLYSRCQSSLPPPSPSPRKKERWRVLCNSLKKDIKSQSKLWASLINVNELVMI